MTKIRNDIIKNKTFNRRAFILGGAHVFITCILGSKLYQLQIKKNKLYKSLSDGNRIKISFTPPIRGKILDRQSIEMATNKISYKILYILGAKEDSNQLINNLQTITKISLKPNVAEKLRQRNSSIIIIYEDVSWEVLANIEFNASMFPGINIATFYKRYYPFAQACAHIIGYVTSPHYNNQHYQKEGVIGIEHLYDQQLRGEPGIIQQEVNAKRQVVKDLSSSPGRSGTNIQTTIDSQLSQKISEMFAKETGAAVVIDVDDGHIIALCNSPSYDNNKFISGFSEEDWKKINNDPDLPLINRAINMKNEPGSAFKLISAITALQDGIITSDTKFLCEGQMVIGDTIFRCWKHSGHGLISVQKAIASSCNCFFYNIGLQISLDSLITTAETFGFNQLLHTNLMEESPGLLPTKQWRKKHLNTKWQLGDTLNIIIGHGYLATTPLQLSVMAARFATGSKVLPTLNFHNQHSVFPSLGINSEYIQWIRNAMFATTNFSMGTAYQYLPKTKELGIKIAGKTGTAQIVNSRQEKLANPKHAHKNHGIFISYGPYYKPKYAVSVFIEHAGSSSKAVAIADKIYSLIC